LKHLPAGCEWHQLSGDAAKDNQAIRTATSYWHRGDGSVLVLADPTMPHRHADIARAGDGIQVVENLDLKPVIQAVARLDQATMPERLHVLLDLAHSVMTGIKVNDILRRCDILQRGRSRTPATPVEATALVFSLQPDWVHAEATLRHWSAQAGCKVFRREVLRMLLDCFNAAATGRQPSLTEAIASARERRRHQGRSTAARSIGSTLLLKGLEADYSVLLDLEGLDSPHIYVALTRSTRGMLVLSRSRWLGRTR
jgi:DNA helicase-2/ATP-dependent DNA helicase PcrA